MLEKQIVDILKDVGTPLTLAALYERAWDSEQIPQFHKDDVRRACDALFCQGRIVRIYVFINGTNAETHTYYTTEKLAREIEEQW